MADKISSYGRHHLDINSSRTRSSGRVDQGADAVGAAGTQAQRGDAVELTGTATLLKRIEARLAGVPEVDRARVSALRQQIRSGEYEIDADRLAGKLLRLEKELG